MVDYDYVKAQKLVRRPLAPRPILSILRTVNVFDAGSGYEQLSSSLCGTAEGFKQGLGNMWNIGTSFQVPELAWPVHIYIRMITRSFTLTLKLGCI
jgi:hypothetical protein